MNDPSVSVVIPVYNGARYLGATIESVLAQTRQPDEIIIVDDGSTDDSARIAQRFEDPVRLVSSPHQGTAAARNRGVALAKGRYLAFLDADDLWPPEKIQIQLAIFRQQAETGAVLGQVENFVSPDLDARMKQRLAGDVKTMAGYHSGTLLIRRRVFLEIGYFDETLQSGEFIDWWARAKEKGLRYQMLPAVMMRRRLHSQNHTLRRRETLKDYPRILKAALDRRRKEKR